MKRICVSKRLEDFLLLLDEKPRTRLEIINIGIGSSTTQKLVEITKKWGIVEERIEPDTKRVMLVLTEKGKKFVEKLRELYALIDQEEP